MLYLQRGLTNAGGQLRLTRVTFFIDQAVGRHDDILPGGRRRVYVGEEPVVIDSGSSLVVDPRFSYAMKPDSDRRLG